MEILVEIVNGYQQLNVFTKISILDVSQSSEYVSKFRFCEVYWQNIFEDRTILCCEYLPKEGLLLTSC